MANFKSAFEKTIKNEGGYVLTKIKFDRGGLTFAGITRRYHPDWPGWTYIDDGKRDDPALKKLARDFYKAEFWSRINGEVIQDQGMAESIYDFGVNAHPVTSIKLAQRVVGVSQDGIVGPVTSSALNTMDPKIFHLKFALAKIARYARICSRDRSQKKFLHGWINRTLEVIPK